MADFDTKTEHQDTPSSSSAHHASDATASSRDAGQQTQQAKQEARGMVDQAMGQAQSIIGDQKQAVAGQAEGLAKAMRKMAEQLNTQDQGPIARYVERAADGLDNLSGNLRDQDIDSLAHQVQTLARQQPSLFIGGAVAAGFMVARFLKSSSPHSSGQSYASGSHSADSSYAGGSHYPQSGSSTESINTPAESESASTPT